MLKAVILIGGPQKGTRFRPLSLELPKPLFPVAGFPIIYHHIEACLKLPDIKEVLLIGAYQPSEALNRFIFTTQRELNISLRYLQEYTTLGTAGGLYHFRDQILAGKPEGFFVFNGDICCDFPMVEMWNFHRQVEGNGKHFTMLATQATRKQSLQYGCLVENEETHEVLHYVEKPQTFVSSSINCGVYIFTPEIFTHIGAVFLQNQADVFNGGDYINPVRDCIRLEQDILSPLAGTKKLFVFQSTRFWSQIKSAGSAIYANRLYLSLFRSTHPERLARNNDNGPKIIGDVFIHPTARVDSTATLGPNVTVGAGATVGPGVRIKESLILEGALLQDHSCILHSIIGWNSSVGAWSRVEGTANDPNPNDKHAKIDSSTLFNEEGKLNPSITILGRNVVIPSEVMVLNAILLPDKELSGTFKNQILL